MLRVITNNPYRYLGVCANATVAERLANSRRINAFLKVKKTVSFPLDLNNYIPEILRSIDGLNTATSCINLPKDQLKYALFWFFQVSSIDKMALEYLQKENLSKASELFGKKESFSSLINQGILAFITGDNGRAIYNITKVIHDDDYREALVNSICGSNFQITEEEVAHLFIDTLLEEIKVVELKTLFEENGTSDDDDDYLNEKTIGEPIQIINSAIAQAKSVKNNDAQAQYEAGIELMNSTKEPLAILEEHLFTGEYVMEDVAMLDIGLPIQVPRKVYNEQYTFIADKLSKQILQCGINYYNNANEEEDEEIEKALTLQKYALSIAVGKLTRDRCKENVNILNKKKQELPPKEVRYYDKLIKDALAIYMSQPDKISYAIDLIKKTIPYLMSIKETLGASNNYYLRVSTLIVNASLHNVIEEFNNVMNDSIKIELLLDRDAAMRKIRNLFNNAWKATLYMDKLDMEAEFKNGRYLQNRNSLKNQVEELVNIYQSVTLDMRGENKIFHDCKTINDYNNYLVLFPDGKYALQAKQNMEKAEFDACKTTQDCQKFRDKYPKTRLPILDKWEECYYNNCNTISLLEAYLRDYTKGKYVKEAKDKIDRLSFNACRTIANYKNYIQKFPKGKFVSKARDKIDQLSFEACKSIYDYKSYIEKFPNGSHTYEAKTIIDRMSFDGCKTVYHYQQYLKEFPSGRFRTQAQQIIDDEQMWERCVNSDSKDLYKQYLAKFPNGRHKSEAEQKASACYIATMVYGDYNHPQVLALRNYRDNTLRKSYVGRLFISFYYKYSPTLVNMMEGKKAVNKIIRIILDNILKVYNNEKL